MVPKTPQTEAFWREFASHADLTDEDYAVAAFGDSARMASELARLVLSGIKRATASLKRDYGPGREPLPRVGDWVVMIDGEGTPRCIWRTTSVEVKALEAVDDSFAWDEGEGDRSREWWLKAHLAYFSRQAARDGFVMSASINTVFERFTVVWPLSVADRVGQRLQPP